jgi:hypothetical protein
MTRSTCPRWHQLALQKLAPGKAGAPTVASLGVRLVPIDVGRERELAKLIASCEILQDECERLFQRIVDLLADEADLPRGDGNPLSRTTSE